MLNKHNFNLAKLAAKETSRYTLTSINVEPHQTTVTDGYQLTRVTGTAMKSEDFPVTGSVVAVDDFRSFLLPAAAALRIAKAIPKEPIEILNHAAVGADTDKNGYAQIIVNDLETPQVFQPKKADGRFPDAERVIPPLDGAGAPKLRIGLSLDVLLPVLNQAKEFMAGEKSKVVTLSIYDPDSAVRIDAKGGIDQEFLGVVMPCRI